MKLVKIVRVFCGHGTHQKLKGHILAWKNLISNAHAMEWSQFQSWFLTEIVTSPYHLHFEFVVWLQEATKRQVHGKVPIMAIITVIMYTLKALIPILLAVIVKTLIVLRAKLRAHVKGLIITTNLICNLHRSPHSHLLATSLDVLFRKYLHHPILGTFIFIHLCQLLHQSNSASILAGLKWSYV